MRSSSPQVPRRARAAGPLLLLAVLASAPVLAQVQAFPASFKTSEVSTNGTTLHVRVGGQGPAVVLLHGFGDTGDMWAPLAADLVRDHRVVVPDLRGMGLSARPAAGYDKKNQALDLAGLLDSLGIDRADLVTHDIGNMVGYAFVAQFPSRVIRWVVMDAPLPGLGSWSEQLKNPLVWHFNFQGPDVERLVAGRERIYLDRFYNQLSKNPAKWTEAARAHYAELYARPGAMHAAFEQFKAFTQDAKDNPVLASKGPLRMPVLAVGGEASYGRALGDELRQVAVDVRDAVVPDAGHWLMEEQPAFTVKLIRGFLDTGPVPERRLTPQEIAALPPESQAAGTAGPATQQTRVLFGNPSAPGFYAIEVRVPPRTRIASHTHQDARDAVVLSGTFHLGYGDRVEDAKARALPAGSVYTEPPGVSHFAFTGDEPATVVITGIGPTDTHWVVGAETAGSAAPAAR